jgi:hypothetical protein
MHPNPSLDTIGPFLPNGILGIVVIAFCFELIMQSSVFMHCGLFPRQLNLLASMAQCCKGTSKHV